MKGSTANSIRGLASVLPEAAKLLRSTDLNSYTAPGPYAVSGGFKHAPAGASGDARLDVWVKGAFVRQTYTQLRRARHER